MEIFEYIQKIEYTTEENTKISLVDFVHVYFKRQFPDDENRQLEWGYNLVASCRRFRSSDDIKLFWSILSGEVRILLAYLDFTHPFRRMKKFIIKIALFRLIIMKKTNFVVEKMIK